MVQRAQVPLRCCAPIEQMREPARSPAGANSPTTPAERVRPSQDAPGLNAQPRPLVEQVADYIPTDTASTIGLGACGKYPAVRPAEACAGRGAPAPSATTRRSPRS